MEVLEQTSLVDCNADVQHPQCLFESGCLGVLVFLAFVVTSSLNTVHPHDSQNGDSVPYQLIVFCLCPLQRLPPLFISFLPQKLTASDDFSLSSYGCPVSLLPSRPAKVHRAAGHVESKYHL